MKKRNDFSNYKLIIFLLILLFITPKVIFTKNIKITDYLYADIFLEQKILNSYSESIKYLERSSFEVPYIDDIQIRTSIDELDFNYQETSIRFIPKIFGIEKTEEKLFDSYKQYYNTEKELILLNNLKNRYLNVILNTQSKDLFDLNKQLLKMYEELINAKKDNINDFKVLEDIIKIEEDITKGYLKNISIESNISISNNSINTVLNKRISDDNERKNIDFNINNFIMIEDIKRNLKNEFSENYNDISLNNFLLKKEENSYNIELSRYDMDKKRNEKNFLSFIELSYDNKYYYEEGEIDDAFSIGVGFSFSFLNNNDSYLKRRYINILKEKNNFVTKKNELSYEFLNNLNSLKKMIDQYLFLKNRIDNSYAKFALDTYINDNQIDPVILLEAKIKVFKNKILLAELKQKILNNYIEIMYISGVMYTSIDKKDVINIKPQNFLETDE